MAIAVAATATVLASMAAPASAHPTQQNICGGLTCYGTVAVNGTHNTITLCDTRNDTVSVGVQIVAGGVTTRQMLPGTAPLCRSAAFVGPPITMYRGFTSTGLFMPWVAA
jgi:hypothetical protein